MVDLLDPLLVTLTDGRVPTVGQVELDRALVAEAGRSGTGLLNLGTGIQTPGGVGAVQVDNGAQVIVQSDVNVQTASDKTTGLEQVLITLGPGLLGVLLGQTRAGLTEATVLVDLSQLANDVVVETVQHNQQDTAGSRKGLQTTLGEAIGLQLSVLVGTNQILLLLDITVQDGQVKVSGGLVQVLLAVVGLEDIYGTSILAPEL